jgi:hypothetical protein
MVENTLDALSFKASRAQRSVNFRLNELNIVPEKK